MNYRFGRSPGFAKNRSKSATLLLQLLFVENQVLFTYMNATATRVTAAGQVRQRVQALRGGSFLRATNFAPDFGTRAAIEVALARLVNDGELIRVRNGLYWRGSSTPFGMLGPTPLQVALEIGGPGSGPSGLSAARMLGLTTQVPATVEVAVPGKVPMPLEGVRFRSRPHQRMTRKLRPIEVAILEVLREPATSELPWSESAERIEEFLGQHDVRQSVLEAEVTEESSRGARERWLAIVG